MSVMLRVRPAALALALVSLLALPGLASGQVMKHSGSIVAMDRDAGTLTLAEVGPWRTDSNGMTVVDTLTVTMTPETMLTLVYRSPDAASGFPGDWVEEKLETWNLFHGDYVTIDCLHKGTTLLARHVTVLETEMP